MLATAIKKLLPVDYQIMSYDLPKFDLTSRDQVFALAENSPAIIINCAAYTNVDGCEDNRDLAMRVNGTGSELLAELAKTIDALLVHISTDFVFAGNQQTPYVETDPVDPLSVYGKSKLVGEQQIQQSGLEKYFIVRTSWLYGVGKNNFVETIMRLAGEREELGIVTDQLGTPTYTEDLARAIFTLLDIAGDALPVTRHSSPITDLYGIYHYSNDGMCSWYDFAGEIVRQMRQRDFPVKVKTIKPITTAEYPVPAERPKYSVLSKEKIIATTGMDIPPWQESLDQYFTNR